MIDFIWPIPPGTKVLPQWTGKEFIRDGNKERILYYSEYQDSWGAGLTEFHEENAGQNHFIDIASRRNAIAELKTFLKVPEPIILEIGSSSGYLLPMIQQAFPQGLVMGSDSFPDALGRMAGELPGIPLLQFDLLHCPLHDNSVDALVLLNVFEHIEEDAKGMAQLYRILKPGGIVVIEVPAGSHLYDIYDELLMHFRRYDMGALKEMALSCGFNILRASHLGFFLYPGFYWVKKRNQKHLHKEDVIKKNLVAGAIANSSNNLPMMWVMALEFIVGRFVRFPFGTRCLLTLKK